MSTNWVLCLFCQEKKRNKQEHGELSSYSRIETQLKKFIEIDPTYIELGLLDDGTGIAKTLETHNAVFHKKCYDKIGQKMHNRLLARVGKKPCSEANSSSSTVIPHNRTKTELCKLEQGSAFFVEKLCSTENVCAAGEFHSGSIQLCTFENLFLMGPTDHVTNIQTYFE